MTETEKTENTQTAAPPKRFALRLLGLCIRLIIPACIVAAAAGFFKHQMDTRPQAQRTKPQRQARAVTVETVHVGDHRALITAMGRVRPAREITLNPEVSGVIIRIDPAAVPGGLIDEGQELFAIDPRDYQALLTQRESEVARARLNLKLEAGNQLVAQAEYRLLEEVISEEDAELVLRKPHMADAQGALDAAIAALEKARLDVERCTIRAPFNAIIMEKYVDVGARVSPTSALLCLIGTDEYWIEASVFVDELGLIEIPQSDGQQGSLVRVFNPTAWGDETYRLGRVLRLRGAVEEAGRNAQVLVSVKDPLSIDEPGNPLLLSGSYVRMEIEGRMIPGVIPVSRAHLRDGDNVWVMNNDDALEIRPVKVAFRGRDRVYISEGLREGERIVTTDLGGVVEGMPLRLFDAPSETEAAAVDAGGPEQK